MHIPYNKTLYGILLFLVYIRKEHNLTWKNIGIAMVVMVQVKVDNK